MKQRVISGVFIALVTFLACFVGGYLLAAICGFIAVWGSKEVISLRTNRKFNVCLYIIMLISVLLLSFGNKLTGVDGIQTIIVLCELIALCSYAVFEESINFEDVGTILVMSIILGYGCYFFMLFEGISKYLFGYVIIISYLADVFACSILSTSFSFSGIVTLFASFSSFCSSFI